MNSRWVMLLGVVGSIASIIALWLSFGVDAKKEAPPNQRYYFNGSNNDVTNNQISNNSGSITFHQVYPDTNKDLRDFRKFVPKTYLQNLPKVKYNAYMEAHKYWDTGVTSQMLEGNNVLADILLDILINLAKTAYTSDYFEGKSIPSFYNEQISRLMDASYDAQPNDGGSIHVLMAHADRSTIIDEFVVRVVEDVSDPSYFQVWKKKWDVARDLGAKGVAIDLDLTPDL